MKKSIKILFILLVLTFITGKCFAVNIEMNLNSVQTPSTNQTDSTTNSSTSNSAIQNPALTNIDANTPTNDLIGLNTTLSNSDENGTSTDTTTGNQEASTTNTVKNTSTNVSNLSSLPESDLGLTNILNIILIAIGFILILLAIAILIRLSNK